MVLISIIQLYVPIPWKFRKKRGKQKESFAYNYTTKEFKKDSFGKMYAVLVFWITTFVICAVIAKKIAIDAHASCLIILGTDFVWI